MVVAGLTELVAVELDDVVVVWCVEVLLLSPAEDEEEDAEDAEEDADEFCVVEEEVEVDVEAVTVVKVLGIVDLVESVVDEDAEAEVEDAEVEVAEAADNEIKLPPLESNVTVCCPLTTSVDAVIVVCGCPLPELIADVSLTTLPTEVLVVKSNEYVVFGNKLLGNVANADESTEIALVVCTDS